MCKTIALIPSLVFAFTLLAKESSVVDYGQSSASTSYNLVWSYDVQTEDAVPFAIITGVHGSNGTGTASPVGSIAVPESITDTSTGNGYIVKRIGNGAFANSIGMTSVTLPSTLERIGNSAFANCTSLASVTIPYGVREIGKRPFVNTIITGLALPDSIIKLDGNIAAGALFDLGNALSDSSHFLVTEDGAVYNRDQTKLYSCPTRTEGTLNLPESLTEIGADAFFGCFRLTYLNVPASVTNIGETAFNVSGIWPGLDAPESAAKLQSIYFEGSAPSAAEDIFSGAPETLVNYAFSDDQNWTDPWKGRPMTVIPDDANPPILSAKDELGITWYYRIRKGFVEICNEDANGNPIAAISPKSTSGQTYEDKEAGLKQSALRIPKSINGFAVTKIGDSAFDGCEGLTSIGIPGSVTEIGDHAFRGCKALKSIDVWDNVPWETTQGHINLPYGINKIGYRAFEGVQLQVLSLPDTVTELDGNPAAGCANLTTIEVSSANPKFTVVDGVLYNKRKTTLLAVPACLDISTVTLPASVTAIADESFCGCQYLDTIVLPSNLAAIGSGAFANCATLVKVTFEGVEPAAPDSIFDGSENVTVYGREEDGWSGDTWKDRPLVVIPGGDDTALMQTVNGITWRFRVIDSVAEIWNGGATAVAGDNPPILSLTLPQALGGYVVKGIGDGALSGLRGLTSMSIPSTYEWIGDSAFSNCTSLAAVTIPEGVREIGHWPFYGTALTELSIPDSVSAIDGNPVAGAALMKEIKVSDAQPYFAADDGLLYNKDKSALLACPATKKTIALTDTVEAIADDAFYGCTLLDGGKHTIDGVDWFYDITDTGAVVTNINGATNNVVIPKSLSGLPIVAIEPTAFNNCTGITGFSVKLGNTAFAAKNGALYSADGKTLIRVPDTYLLPAKIVETRTESSVSETVIPLINPDGTDGTTTTRSVTPAKTTTRTTQIEPTVPMEQLLDGVAQIADFAFFGCGAGFEPSETVQTNDFTSETGFIDDTVFVRSTYTCATVSLSKESIILIPEGVVCGPDAFTGSGATEIQPVTVMSSIPDGAEDGPDPALIAPETLDESSTYLGWISRNGIIDGNVTLKTAKMRKGVMKISGSVQLLGEKKVSVKSLDAATPAGCELVIAKDVSKTGAFDNFKGRVITIALGTQDNDGSPMMSGCSTLTVTIAAKGKAKVSGYLADGTRVSVSAQMITKDGKFLLPVFAPLYTGKKGGFAFILDLSGASAQIINMSKLVSIISKTPYSVTLGILAVGHPAAAISKDIFFLETDLPTGYAVNGQLIGWNPRYTKKSGLITGSLTVLKGKKKVKAKIYGIRVNGEGFGTAVIKNAGSWPVLLD